MKRPPPRSTLFPYTTLFRSRVQTLDAARADLASAREHSALARTLAATPGGLVEAWPTLTVAERRSILTAAIDARSEEHTSELQSQSNLVCRLLLEKKNNLTI